MSLTTTSPEQPLVLDASFSFEGGTLRVRSGRPVVVSGDLRCSVEVEGPLVVARGGTIGAEFIRCGALILSGGVECKDLEVKGLLMARTGSDLRGDKIRFGDLERQRGALLRGMTESLENGCQYSLSPVLEKDLVIAADSGVARPVSVEQIQRPWREVRTAVLAEAAPAPVQAEVMPSAPAVDAESAPAATSGGLPAEPPADRVEADHVISPQAAVEDVAALSILQLDIAQPGVDRA